MRTPEQQAEVKRQWLRGLVEGGINTAEKLNAGLARCRAHNSPFLPSVGQFVTWCNEAAEQESGFPSEASALADLNSELARSMSARNWSRHHPAVYWAYTQRSTFDWKSMSAKDQRQVFSEVWQEARRMVRRGFDFKACLPKPSEVKAEATKSCDPAVAEAARNEIFEALKITPTGA